MRVFAAPDLGERTRAVLVLCQYSKLGCETSQEISGQVVVMFRTLILDVVKALGSLTDCQTRLQTNLHGIPRVQCVNDVGKDARQPNRYIFPQLSIPQRK